MKNRTPLALTGKWVSYRQATRARLMVYITIYMAVIAAILISLFFANSYFGVYCIVVVPFILGEIIDKWRIATTLENKDWTFQNLLGSFVLIVSSFALFGFLFWLFMLSSQDSGLTNSQIIAVWGTSFLLSVLLTLLQGSRASEDARRLLSRISALESPAHRTAAAEAEAGDDDDWSRIA